MMEFTFEDMASPWALATARLRRGQTMTAQRFLTLVRSSEELLPEDAALELEQMGVMLDVSGLPKLPGNPDTAARLRLEAEVLEQGNLDVLDEKDPLRLFLEELEGLKPIADGSDLASRSALGEEQAMQALTAGYLPTVFDCAREYAGRGVLLMDLIQEGSMGLWQGILSYADGPFRPHALWWIRQAMARAVTLQAESDGVGDHLAQQIAGYRKADRELLTRLGRTPTEEEIAQKMGVSLEEAISLGKMLGEIQAMAKIQQETRKEDAPEEEAEQAVEDTAYYQTRERVNDLMSGLTQQETQVLNLRYGLDGKPPVSAREAGEKLHLTPSEVSEIEARALAKMRQ